MAGWGFSTKDIAMIIQNTPHLNQAVQPDVRANGVAPVRAAAISTTPPVPRPVPVEELKSAVATINQAMRQSNHSLEFSVDSDTHRTVVKMVDTGTGELIRQFPSETALAISRGIDQFQQGLLLKQKA
jgi:flagellar protein FlaG